jgi:nucleotide-binding universal stress UspA family protein
MTMRTSRSVLVGIDGSDHSRRALDWAVAEASSRSIPLHLVHALETGVTVWSPMLVSPTTLDDQRWVVEAALERVHAIAPELTVTSEITTGPAAVALEQAAAQADTLVVGARGRGVVGSILLGSTSLHAASHAPCPVVVVRDADDDPAKVGQSSHVVVGFDGSHLSDDALAYAFAAASVRHRDLDIVIAWNAEDLATYQLVPTIAEEVRATAAQHRQELAAAAAAPWAEKHPEVKSHIQVVVDTPAQALIDRSYQADLVVVGSRGLGSVRGALLGSVSAEVLRHSHCPIAVIRPGAG